MKRARPWAAALLLWTALAAPCLAAPSAEEQAAISQINYRRGQVGLGPLGYNATLEQSSRAHANYLAANGETGHSETLGLPGFTGATPFDRMVAAGYGSPAASNEVISFGASTGVSAVEGLIQAIYHRFGIFSSSVSEIGAGIATNHPTYGTVLVVNSALPFATPPSPGSWVGVYPYDGQGKGINDQDRVPRSFLSDTESPDPVAGSNKVGYPISIHVDAGKTLSVASPTSTNFTVAPVGGSALPAQLLTAATDPNGETPASVAALIPLAPLAYDTEYEVYFNGTAGGAPLTRTWRFRTAPLLPITFSPAQPYLAYNSTLDIQISGGSGVYTGASYSGPATVAFTGPSTLRVTSQSSSGSVTIVVTDDEANQEQVVVQVQLTVDSTPNPFSFPAVTGAALSTVVQSASITVSGINVPTAISVAGGGEYSISTDGVNFGPFTNQAGTVMNGNTVRVRLTSSAIGATTTSATLTIDSVSAVFSVTTLDNQSPSVPTGLAIGTIAANSLTLNWNASGDNVAVTAYQVFRGGVIRATVSGTTSFTDTGLASATLYSYSVAACDAAGNRSAQTGTVSATTLDNVPPAAPTGLSITNLAADSLTLNWTAATDNVAVTDYQVFRNGMFRATVSGATSFNDSGLTTVTLYSYTVAACDAAGNCSGQSLSVSATTLDNVPPAVPAGLTATAISGAQINLAWGSSTDNVGVTAYQVFRGGVFRATVFAPAVSFSDTGLANNTTYSYAVQACDAAGNCSAPSAPASATTPDAQAPLVPAGLTATAVSGSRINLAWSASTDNVGVTAYQVFRAGAFRVTVTAPATSFSDTGLTASTAYSYTVAACDAAGNCSAQSAAASATTLAAGSASFTPNLAENWNLLGNALNITLDVAAIFGGNSNIASVWKWDAATQSWAYYSPALTAEQLIAFTTSRAYQVLATIGPGEGYWVNALNAITLPAQSGAEFSHTSTSFDALPSSWNLIATAAEVSPHAFANAVSDLPDPGTGVNDAFLSLWAWDAARQNWYYYAPALENVSCGATACGLAGVKSYTDARGLLHFEDYGKTLGQGVSFWVNRR